MTILNPNATRVINTTNTTATTINYHYDDDNDNNNQMVYAQPGIRPRKWDAQNSLGIGDTNGLPNLGRTIRPSDSQLKKKNEKKKKRKEPAK